MYDPRVVDTFVAIYATLPQESADASQNMLAELVSGSGIARQSIRSDIRDRLIGTPSGSEAGRSIEEIGRALTRALESFGPDVVCAIYRHETQTDDLVATYISSARHRFIVGTRIPLGERVSGWVGANRRTIVNSDPQLDLGTLASQATPRLHRSLATPLVCGEALMGVCTLYSADPRGFSEEHARWLELLVNDVVGRIEPSASVATLASRVRPARRLPPHHQVIRPFDRDERPSAARAFK
jgi:hypothetical protein